MIADRIDAIQATLAASDLDGWLFVGFQQSDPISLTLLGLNKPGTLVTRRCYYLVPRSGPARKLVHALESTMLDHLPGERAAYLTWQENRDALATLITGCRRLAAQYSPNNELPAISRLDAGTAELLRATGVELVPSGDLVQRFAATWSEAQLAGHRRTCAHLHEIVHAAYARVGEHLRADRAVDEYAIQRFILEQMDQRGLHTESSPIVAVNAHSADPHYQPSAESHSPIAKGDFLLIDLWAKEKADDAVYADICWNGVCAASPTARQAEVFDAVMRARDAAYDLIASRYPATPVRGYEVDDAARGVIDAAGYGPQFIHRTGHSIDTADHGQGANMDNLETHDTRLLMAHTGFSIEPGIYLEGDFGVRSEINVALTPEAAEITGGAPQRALICLLD
ncbi:MAG: M24 family metallopeptidase [Acidobacteriota bacterium]